MSAVKERLKGLASEDARRRVRKLGRLRWLTKASVLRRYELRFREAPGRWLRYVLWDPEVDTFTYAVGNVDELVALLADLTGLSAADLARYAAEPATDPELTTELSRRVRWRFDTKTKLPLVAHQLASWTLVRALKPATAVECGILDGLASLTMLRALERNGQEGHPGRLVSFDVMPSAGHLVSDRLRADWEPVFEDSAVALPRVLAGREVGFFISDSLPESDHVRRELEAVLPHAAEQLVVLQVWGALEALHDVGRERGVPVRLFQERPADHFYVGNEIAFAAFDRS